MKTYKELQEKIQIIAEGQETVGGAARSAHSDFGVHRVENENEVGRLNAFLKAFTQREFLEPKGAMAQIRHKMNMAGLEFDWDNTSVLNIEDTMNFPLRRWGGSFGTTPTHDLKKGFFKSDNISEYNGGVGLGLRVDVIRDNDGLYEIDAKVVPNKEESDSNEE
tara:strand:+ start:522 stop:1013 length:492 start_codon:yes stop_codon:yes gene_type:complete